MKMSAGNSRDAYMREYRKRKRLEEDNCNNVPKRTKLRAERHIETYLPNICVLNFNPRNQISPIIFCVKNEKNIEYVFISIFVQNSCTLVITTTDGSTAQFGPWPRPRHFRILSC
jgi:hypothetical protein